MAPACAVTVALVMSRMAFIFDIWISVPPSAVPQADVEWFDPTARTGAGYLSGFFRTVTMSLTEVASTMTAGCETMFSNQFVTVLGMIGILYGLKLGIPRGLTLFHKSVSFLTERKSSAYYS